MNWMICMNGEPEQRAFLPEIAELGAGIELGSYGLVGIRSAQDWETRLALHQAVRAQFKGTIALHGPFLGMDYTHLDCLMRDAVNRRLDMIFDVALQLKAARVVLHTGCRPDIELFKLQDWWLKTAVEFWLGEMQRWAAAGIQIVLENETERSPHLMLRLVDEVNNPFLGLCMDIGHQHMFSALDASEWVRTMGRRLWHIHLHDNDGSVDRHWSLGRGTIDFEPFFAAITQHVPQVTISLEAQDGMEPKMADLRTLAARFEPTRPPGAP